MKLRFRVKPISVDYAFVDRLTLILSSEERKVAEGYKRLMPRRFGPFRILSVGPMYLEISRDSVANIMSINRSILNRKANFCNDVLQYSSAVSIAHEHLSQKTKRSQWICKKGGTYISDEII